LAGQPAEHHPPRPIGQPEIEHGATDRRHEAAEKEIPERANIAPGLVLLANLGTHEEHRVSGRGVVLATVPLNGLDVIVRPVTDNQPRELVHAGTASHAGTLAALFRDVDNQTL
jgi:hypothetical protein